MIGHLRGAILDLEPEVVLLGVGGVGYRVHIPLSTYYELQRLAAGEEAALFVHTHVRDDALALFGFWTVHERRLFEKLIAVSGIGPRLAQVVLSGMPPEELTQALAEGDTRRLNAIPGVGKKTAERMVLELRDKVQALAAETSSSPAGPADADLVEALVNLGYRRGLAEKAVAGTTRAHPGKTFPELLRLSLKSLAKA